MTSIAEPKQLGDHIISLVKPLDPNRIGKALYDLCEIADSFRRQEAWEEALECCRTGHELIGEMAGQNSRNIEIDYCEGIVLLYEGTIYLSQEKNQAAEDCFRRSADTHSRIDLRNEGIAWLGLGITLESKGDLTRALEAYQLSLNVFNYLTGNRGSIRIEAVSRLERVRDRLRSDLEKRIRSRDIKQQKGTPKTLPLPKPKLEPRWTRVPVVGRIMAGEPVLVDEKIEDHIIVDDEIARDADFALRVQGDSMINAHIVNGDLTLIRQQQQATPGDIIAVAITDLEPEGTLKRFFEGNDYVRLQPENDNEETLIILDKDAEESRIRDELASKVVKIKVYRDVELYIFGKVIAVLRTLNH